MFEGVLAIVPVYCWHQQGRGHGCTQHPVNYRIAPIRKKHWAQSKFRNPQNNVVNVCKPASMQNKHRCLHSSLELVSVAQKADSKDRDFQLRLKRHEDVQKQIQGVLPSGTVTGFGLLFIMSCVGCMAAHMPHRCTSSCSPYFSLQLRKRGRNKQTHAGLGKQLPWIPHLLLPARPGLKPAPFLKKLPWSGETQLVGQMGRTRPPGRCRNKISVTKMTIIRTDKIKVVKYVELKMQVSTAGPLQKTLLVP